MALKHDNPNGSQAFAPYNFVPLPEKIVPAPFPLSQDSYEGLTGWIDCTLETRSPTYIRGMLTEEQNKERIDAEAPEMTEDERKAWEKTFKEKQAPFFATTEETVEGSSFLKPVISGSSLRGMVRTLVEVIGYGRMRWVANNPTFTFRAVAAQGNDPLSRPYDEVLDRGRKVQAGYLVQKGEDWYIQPALIPKDKQWPWRSAPHYIKVDEEDIDCSQLPEFIPMSHSGYQPQFHPVSFEPGPRKRKKKSRYKGKGSIDRNSIKVGSPTTGYQYEGVLVCSGNMLETKPGGTLNRFNHALLLPPNNDLKKRLTISRQAIADYRAGLTPFQKEALAHSWAGGEWGCLKDGAPIFYVAQGKEVIYFGHSPNFRIPARLQATDRAATPQDFVPEALHHNSKPDLADAIFGWVEEADTGPEQQCAGRVFFEDAHFIEASQGIWYETSPLPLHVLAEPKPTTFQHYLVQNRNKGHDPDRKSSLAHYGSSPATTEIRGYKFYWLKGSAPDIRASEKELEHESQLTRIVPLKAGVKFSFRLRFENLREEELGALLWALSLPGDPDKQYCHRVGMGKPFGMGAVAITPHLTVTKWQERYNKLFQDGAWCTGAEDESAKLQSYIKAFETFILKALGFDPEKTNIRLAEVERIGILLAMFQWHEGDENWVEKTRYMEIEHKLDPKFDETVNEYKERPVLPDPLHVLGIKREWAKPVHPTVPPSQPETSSAPAVGAQSTKQKQASFSSKRPSSVPASATREPAIKFSGDFHEQRLSQLQMEREEKEAKRQQLRAEKEARERSSKKKKKKRK